MPEGMEKELVEQTEVPGGETDPSPETQPEEQHEDPAEALRAMREDSDRLRAEAKFFRDMAMRQPSQSQKKATVEKDPNDFVTAGDIKGLDDRFSSIESRFRAQHEHNCEVAARNQYTDFDDVVMKYTLPLIQAEAARGERHMMDAIDNAENPALAAYFYGRSSEAYIAEKSKASTQKVVSKIEENLKKPGTLGAVKSAKPEAQVKSFKDMTTEEFRAARLKEVGFN